MVNERNILWWAAGIIAAVLAVAVATHEPQAMDLRFRNALQDNRFLYFTNIRSIKYARTDYGGGISTFTPTGTSNLGGFIIHVNAHLGEAHIVWSRGAEERGTLVPRPDSRGMWNPDTAQLATHWHMALRRLQREPKPERVLLDYFELVGMFPEDLKK